ncbi:MAG: LTA synthase family protein [Alphaproteobacteria bacterium]
MANDDLAGGGQSRFFKMLTAKQLGVFSLLLGALPYYVPLMFYGFHLWLWRNFSGPSMETISMLLMFGTKGLEAPFYYTQTGILYLILMPWLVALLLSFFDQWIALRLKKNTKDPLQIKKIGWWRLRIKFFLVLMIVMVSCSIFWRGANITDFVYSRVPWPHQPDYFQQNYIDPKQVAIVAPKKKKNLIVIYVESLEDSFKHPAYYGRNLLAALQPIEDKSLVLNFKTIGTAVHTQSGHVASQCGLPIRSVFFIDLKNTHGDSTVLQNAICLSDILKKYGYDNVFIQAAFRNSAGLADFYNQTHHFDEAYHMEYFQQNGYGTAISEKQGQWGLHDAPILEEGYNKLKELQDRRKIDGTPFFLIIATIDMHLPASSSCHYNAPTNVDNLDKVVECTAQALHDFFAKAESMNLLKDSEILLMGDHRMTAIAYVDIKTWDALYPHRDIYGFIYKQKLRLANERQVTHYDLFPTMLELLDFKVAGGRLGFGYSMFQEFTDMPSIATRQKIMTQALYVSPFYFNLWRQPDKAMQQYMGLLPSSDDNIIN